MSEAALDLLYALRLEDGRCWGEIASDFQKEDAAAILLNERPNPTWHFLTRPRGGSKTTDIAGISLAWLAVDAAPLANGHVIAAKAEQAAILIDAIRGFCVRTPELEPLLKVEMERVKAVRTDAWVSVLAASQSGAWGLRDAHLLICDEFCQWPDTRMSQGTWTAIQSTAPKVANCRLIILSTSGEPSHWSRPVWEAAHHDPLWRVHDVEGPVPWQSSEELEGLRRMMRPSEYQRLVLNQWAQDEERPITEDDYDAAESPYVELTPRRGVNYILTVDIGLINDASVCVVGHLETGAVDDLETPPQIIIDCIKRWKGTPKRPVQLSTVEEWIRENAPYWNHAHCYADPTQFRGSIQRLATQGINIEPWEFTTTSVGNVATGLVQAFRNRQIRIPTNSVLKQELLSVRLRDNGAGVTRLDHAPGQHDDQAVCIGMCCWLLLDAFRGIGRQWLSWMDNKRKQGIGEMPSQTPMTPMVNWNREDKLRTKPRGCSNLHRWRDDQCVLCGAKKEDEVVATT